MSAHLDDDTLLRLLDGALHDRWLEAVATHLDACPRCAARLAALDPLTEHLRASPPPEPPDAVLDAILAELRVPTEPAPRRDARRHALTALAALAALALAAALREGSVAILEVGAALGGFPGATSALLALGAAGWALALLPHLASTRARAR